MEITPIKSALLRIRALAAAMNVHPFYQSPHLPPHLPPFSEGDSIINQFTSGERHPAEDGDEQWQMKDIGKHFLAATVSGCRRWHHLVCSWHRKPNSVFVCVMNWGRGGGGGRGGKGGHMQRRTESLCETAACLGEMLDRSRQSLLR